VGPRAGLDTEVRGKIFSPLPGIESRSPGEQFMQHCKMTLFVGVETLEQHSHFSVELRYGTSFCYHFGSNRLVRKITNCGLEG
jgi:hypothetical protein